MYYHHSAGDGIPSHYGVRTERYKLIYYYGLTTPLEERGIEPSEPEWELFDLAKDPHEMKNVYSDPAYAKVVRDLMMELFRLKRELGDADQLGRQMLSTH